MKTYADLSDDQLAMLHKLAQGGDYTRLPPNIKREPAVIQIRTGVYITECFVQNGDIACQMLGQPQPLSNLWKVVAQCKQWGVTY